MSIETRYYKKLLEKLEIEPIPLYAGDFKSASEPYRVEEMSDSNRVQLKALLVDLYDNYLETISKARGKSITELRNLADSLTIKDPQSALTAA
jgi:protease-4